MSETTAEYRTKKNNTMTNDELHQVLYEKLEEQLKKKLSDALQSNLAEMFRLLPEIGKNTEQIQSVLETVKLLLPSEDKERERQQRRRNREQQAGNIQVTL